MPKKEAPKKAPGKKRKRRLLPAIGWREIVALPDLDIDKIKVKVDTGARTSALHAHGITKFKKRNATYVRFFVHPHQRKKKPEIECTALVVDERSVTDSGGKTTQRYVIRTTIMAGEDSWPIELTLTNRDEMGFRMLVGRQAVRRRFVVDPGRSFVMRKK
ncbi:MAG: ATP-dependent zinc protease [Alphaproteobacteria bacterium]|nr:ATP-dependent zinc protease [Alphaproteobacteria bacterium]